MGRRYSRLIFLLACACARAGAPPEPAPSPTPGTSAPALPSAVSPPSGRSWTIIPGTQPRRYSSIATATLELLADSASTREIITQRARFSLLTGSGSGSTSFLGSIDALSTEASTRVGPSDPQLSFPITFTGHISNGAVIIDALNGQPGTASSTCLNPATSALNIIHRNVVILPAVVTQGMTWKDSTSVAGCSGTIPITTISIRTYRILGETEQNGRSAILIERMEKALSTGEGSENQHRILIRTEGTGTGKMYVDRVSGALLSSDSEQRTELSITAGRLQRFRQVVKETTTADR